MWAMEVGLGARLFEHDRRPCAFDDPAADGAKQVFDIRPTDVSVDGLGEQRFKRPSVAAVEHAIDIKL